MKLSAALLCLTFAASSASSAAHATPPAPTCEVVVDVADAVVYEGEATRSSDEIARRDAWTQACDKLRAATKLDCEDRARVAARQTNHKRSMQITNGDQSESSSYTFALRPITRRTATGTGADRKTACQAAILNACKAANRACPPAQPIVLEVDGVAAKNLALWGSTDPREQTAVKLEVFEEGDRSGYRDERGPVISPRFAVALPFTKEGVAHVVDAQGWALIDITGRVLLRPFVFDNGPDYFADGLARFVDGGKIGFYDARGQIVIPARFEHVRPFSEGRAAFCEGCVAKSDGEHTVLEGGRWGFIDKAGAIVIPPQFSHVRQFEGGTASCTRDGVTVQIDVNGEPR